MKNRNGKGQEKAVKIVNDMKEDSPREDRIQKIYVDQAIESALAECLACRMTAM